MRSHDSAHFLRSIKIIFNRSLNCINYAYASKFHHFASVNNWKDFTRFLFLNFLFLFFFHKYLIAIITKLYLYVNDIKPFAYDEMEFLSGNFNFIWFHDFLTHNRPTKVWLISLKIEVFGLLNLVLWCYCNFQWMPTWLLCHFLMVNVTTFFP